MSAFFPVKTEAATFNCSSCTTLEELFDCIKAQMRLREDGYTVPTAQQLTDLHTVMGQMLDGQTIITLPSSISGIMEFQRFTDSGNSETYSVLMEVEDDDAAHNDDCMFFGATQELMDYYSSTVWHQIQYNGMGHRLLRKHRCLYFPWRIPAYTAPGG